MGYNVSYKHLAEGEERDNAAIEDIRGYINKEGWELFLYYAGRAEEKGTAEACQELNIAFAFAGITGFPFHAFCRKYLPTAYKAWLEE